MIHKPMVGVSMSQWEIDPDLRDRRLAMLVRLLLDAANSPWLADYPLTQREAGAWAHQCSNLLNAPAPKQRKATKPIEQMSDEELLS